jgi:hypothetical protein
MVEVGETFRVYVTNLNTGGQSSRCISGINGPEKEPEYVSLRVSGQSGSGGGIIEVNALLLVRITAVVVVRK